VSKRLRVHARVTAAGIGAAIGLLCAPYLSNAQDAAETPTEFLTVGISHNAQLSPGEAHRYRVELSSGRNEIRLLESGIDVALSVHVDGNDYEADSPTARFAMEPIWFDLDGDSEAIVSVYALRATGVPTGNYTIDIRSGYEAGDARLRAEALTSTAIDAFNASYAAELTPDDRDKLRSQSLDTYLEAATAWKDLNEPTSAAYSWHAAGFISSVLMSQHANAQVYLERAAQEYKAADLAVHQHVARKDVGQSIYREERYSTAAAYLSEMAALADEETAQVAFVGAVAGNELCLLQTELGDFELAIAHCESAMAAFRRIGDVVEYNNVLHNLAVARRLNGDQHGAIQLLRDLLNRHEAVGEPVRYAQTLTVLVGNLIASGEIDAALSAYDRSIGIFEREELPRWQAGLLTKYARIEQLLGRNDQARLHLEEALKLFRQENSPQLVGQVTVRLAEMDLSSGHPAAAIPALQRAVNLFRQIQSLDLLVSASITLANAQLQIGWTEQANATINALGDVANLPANGRARIELTRARILAARDEVDAAIGRAHEAAEQLESIGNRTGQLEAVRFEADLLASQERWGESLARLESLRVIVRQIGRTLVLPQLKARYFSEQQDFYETLIRAYDNASETADDAVLKSLNAIEEARATALRAYLEAPESWLGNAPPAMRTQYDEARQAVAALVQDSFSSETANSPELAQAMHHLERVQNAIWREHTRYVDVNDDAQFTWADIDRVLDRRTAMLYVYISASQQFGVLLEKGRRTRYELVSDIPLSNLTHSLQQELQNPNSGLGIRADSARLLSKALLEPISERLSSIDRLVVVPDAGLHSVPLASLPHPRSSRPLLETHEISNVPSLRAALRYRNRDESPPERFQVAAIGDPVTSEQDPRLHNNSEAPVAGLRRLRGTQNEIAELQDIFGTGDVAVHTGFDARKSLFTGGDLSEANVLHISAHGVSNETLAAKSGIFLSTMDTNGTAIDGHLGVEDLFGIELDVPLVMLSGCETILGETNWSEGPLGIARAFQYSGVPSVVATLWRIDDRSSAILTRKFYERLAAGETVPAALRNAQLSLMDQTEYRHPYYWAAFQALGDWSLRWENTGDGDTKVVQLQ